LDSLRIPEIQLKFLQKLIACGVRFVLIGGYALRFFGRKRPTGDIDILIDNYHENARKLRPLVADYLGYEPKFSVEDLLKPRQQLKTPDKMIDILTSVDGLDFSAAFERREGKPEGEILLPIVSKVDLIFIKESAAKDPKRRKKEIKDIKWLKSRRTNN
jgi:hypothetical protein